MTISEQLAAAGLGLALALCAAGDARGQRQFEQWLAKSYWPLDDDPSTSIAVGDVDGDGDPDVVFGTDGQSRLYRNAGGGTFVDATAGRMPPLEAMTQALALGDVDGDGDLDLVVANDSNQPDSLYLNDGSGTFTHAVGMPQYDENTHAVALGDVDGDFDLDVVFGGLPSRLYLNSGTGKFTDVTAARLPSSAASAASVALGDVDGDADLDLVLGAWPRNVLYLNEGRGTFTDVTASHLPSPSAPSQSLALADVDGDADLDLVLGNRGRQNQLYLNDGTGLFTDATAGRMPPDLDPTLSVALGDVDGDGDLDVALGNGRGAAQNRLYLNDGAGVFADATAARLPAHLDDTWAIAVADVADDPRPEILVANHGEQNRLYFNDGAGAFSFAIGSRLPGGSYGTNAVRLGDVDGDGDPDLVIGLNGRNQLFQNDGTGVFADVTAARMPAISDLTLALASGDVDGDGDSDLLTGNFGQNRLLLNDGTGIFTDATAGRLPALSAFTAALALGDVDGDGDLDLAAGNAYRQRNRLYLNDGAGRFSDATGARLPVDTDDTRALALGDVDGDLDPDLVIGNHHGDPNRLYLNDGNGTFTDGTAGRLPPDQDWTLALALGDVDGDGDLDVVIGNGTITYYGYGFPNRLLVNDGSGVFTDETAARLPAPADITLALALVELDGDGDLDLVVGNWREQNLLYVNDGTGVFADATTARLPSDSDYTTSIALGDVDADGDPDLVFGNGVDPNALYVNLHRQLSTPRFAVLGREHLVDVHAEPGYGAFAHTGLVFLGSGLATAPILLPPFGTFFLNPSPLLALPRAAIPAPAGAGRTRVFIPALPSLVGIAIHMQALILDHAAPFALHLTGYTVDVIAR